MTMAASNMYGQSFQQSTAVKALTSHQYEGNLHSDYCYGTAAHGGFVASVVLSAIAEHFRTTLAHLNQPHTITLHLEYLRPSNAGEIIVDIKDVKPGASTSTVHITALQNGKERVVGYANNMNMNTAKGVSYATDYKLVPGPTPADVTKLAAGKDHRWVGYSNPYHPKSPTKVQTHLKFVMPKNGSPHPSIMDEWITPARSGERFTNEMIGFVADQWPQICENYRAESIHSSEGIVARALRAADGATRPEDQGWRSPFWYPTLSIGIEVKKLLPQEGADWLFVRARAKEIKDGRMDVEVVILDANLELVALSNHVCFIVDIAPTPKSGKVKQVSKM